MLYVQLTLTEFQAGMIGSALSQVESDEPQATEQIGQLADFFLSVANNPAAFPVRDKAMARSLKKRIARLSGPAQPPRPNARKRAQERSIGFSRRTRRVKQEEAALFNAAREAALEALAIEQAQEAREASSIIIPA
jgi:hypothetical protein